MSPSWFAMVTLCHPLGQLSAALNLLADCQCFSCCVGGAAGQRNESWLPEGNRSVCPIRCCSCCSLFVVCPARLLWLFLSCSCCVSRTRANAINFVFNFQFVLVLLLSRTRAAAAAEGIVGKFKTCLAACQLQLLLPPLLLLFSSVAATSVSGAAESVASGSQMFLSTVALSFLMVHVQFDYKCHPFARRTKLRNAPPPKG